MSCEPLTALVPSLPYPEARWVSNLMPKEWEACLDAWIALAEAHLALTDQDFLRISAKDESLYVFLHSYVRRKASESGATAPENLGKNRRLHIHVYRLSIRLLKLGTPSELLIQWQFLANISRLYGKSLAIKITNIAWAHGSFVLSKSLGVLKVSLVKELESPIDGTSKLVDQFKCLNHLFHASAQAASLFMAGSDFPDALIARYKVMNPPLRKIITATLYLCLIGLTDVLNPSFSVLIDQLYNLKAAAEAHQAGPISANDSLVVELVTVTPILEQLRRRIATDRRASARAKAVLASLGGFRMVGGSRQALRSARKKVQRCKARACINRDASHGTIHVHHLSLISQIQDVFPDLGNEYVMRLLDEYNDRAEEVIAHLLDESLPSHLQQVDKSEVLNPVLQNQQTTDIVPLGFTPPLPERRSIYNDDAFDRLKVDMSRLSFGHRTADKTADHLLEDRSMAPNKAAILAALAAFDSDDDERDDTYDVADIGGTVDLAIPGQNVDETTSDIVGDDNLSVLFKAWKLAPSIFGRDAETRRSTARTDLREETGMTNEAIEGWALMLSKDPRQLRRLDTRFSASTGVHDQLSATSWRAGEGTGSDRDDSNPSRGSLKALRGRVGRGRGRGRGRGDDTGLINERRTEAARHRNEAMKGSIANHNRRDQRARKIARAGFPE